MLVGQCLDVGGAELPYAPLVAALRPVSRELGDCRSDLGDRLGPATGAALAELLPELAGPDGAAPSAAGPQPGNQVQLFEALLALLGRVGRGDPVVLVLEDLHWADASTRDFLTFLVRSARAEPLLVVATYRSDELHRRHPLRPVLAELERTPGVERLELRRFTEAELAEQLTGILDVPAPDELVQRVYARSHGNALYAEELVAAAPDGHGELPASLADALLMRVERLPPAAQQVIRAAAVIDRPVPHDLLAAASGVTGVELLDGVREAVANQVLVIDAHGRYAFRHALVGEAVDGDLLPGDRSTMHATVAELLERRPSCWETSRRWTSRPSRRVTTAPPTTCRRRWLPPCVPASQRAACWHIPRRAGSSRRPSSSGRAWPTPPSGRAWPTRSCWRWPAPRRSSAATTPAPSHSRAKA